MVRMTPSLDDYRWLLSAEAGSAMQVLAEPGESLMAQTARLRRQWSLERTHLLLEQADLRRRGAVKFSRSRDMFFTPLGLEQSTDEVVAAYKAARYPKGALVLDLCSGIGGDLLALAERGPVIGVDRQSHLALLAAANGRAVLQNSWQSSAAVVVADAARPIVERPACWHLDPDRRPQGKRTTRVEDHEPGLPVIEALRSRCSEGAIKLAPAAQWPEAWNDEVELEWISRGGECRQLVAWFGDLARCRGQHAATILSRCDVAPRTITGQAGLHPPIADRIGRFVYEPDAAVLAAGLVAALAGEHRLSALALQIAYLTGDGPIHDPALACFEVLDALPYDARRMKTLLRERGIGRLEVKKRGVPHDPAQVRKQLQVPGDAEATLILAPLARGVTALLTRRCRLN
jgi:hypothetical protein